MVKNSYKADVVVVGGGIAGVISALSAASQGSRVIIIERNQCLGGTYTSGMLGEMNAVYHNGSSFVSETGRLIVDALLQEHAGTLHKDIPMTSNPDIRVDRLRYNSEYLKIILDRLIQDHDIKAFFCSELDTIQLAESGAVRVTINNTHEMIEIAAKILIDSTGNAECFYLLNGSTEKNSNDNNQPLTLMFRMGNVNLDIFRTLSIDKIRIYMAAGFEQGVLPAKILALAEIPGTNEISVNATRSVDIDHESIEDISQALIDTRKQVYQLSKYLQKNVDGFEHAHLSSISPDIGIRDSRRIKGTYKLTGKDILAGKKFEDAIAAGAYPVDIHNSKNNSVDFKKINGDGTYYIPYRSLITEEFDTILANGKCISVDNTAFGSIRVMGPLMNIAEASGLAANLAARQNLSIKDIDIARLQEILKKRGMPI